MLHASMYLIMLVFKYLLPHTISHPFSPLFVRILFATRPISSKLYSNLRSPHQKRERKASNEERIRVEIFIFVLMAYDGDMEFRLLLCFHVCRGEHGVE